MLSTRNRSRSDSQHGVGPVHAILRRGVRRLRSFMRGARDRDHEPGGRALGTKRRRRHDLCVRTVLLKMELRRWGSAPVECSQAIGLRSARNLSRPWRKPAAFCSGLLAASTRKKCLFESEYSATCGGTSSLAHSWCPQGRDAIHHRSRARESSHAHACTQASARKQARKQARAHSHGHAHAQTHTHVHVHTQIHRSHFGSRHSGPRCLKMSFQGLDGLSR